MSIIALDGDTTVCEPSLEEGREGIDVEREEHLESIAREGLCAPVTHPWKACTANGKDLFDFNSETGETTWDHPCDEKHRNKVEEYSEHHIARRFSPSPAMESMLENSWCGGIKDHERTFEEIQSRVEAKCNVRPPTCLLPKQIQDFAQKIMDYADVTQEEIDAAWLDAAVDVLGRPAVRRPLRDSFGRSAYGRFRLGVRSDYRTTFPPTSAFDVDRYDINVASAGSFDFLVDVERPSEVAQE